MWHIVIISCAAAAWRTCAPPLTAPELAPRPCFTGQRLKQWLGQDLDAMKEHRSRRGEETMNGYGCSNDALRTRGGRALEEAGTELGVIYDSFWEIGRVRTSC